MAVMERPKACRCGQKPFGALDQCRACFNAEAQAEHARHDNQVTWRVCVEEGCIETQRCWEQARKAEETTA